MVKLEDYTVIQLKKLLSSFNKNVKFANYSKKKKADLIKMIRTHPKIKVVEGPNEVNLSIRYISLPASSQDKKPMMKKKRNKITKAALKKQLDSLPKEQRKEKRKLILKNFELIETTSQKADV
mgnify:CR=1 FL=1